MSAAPLLPFEGEDPFQPSIVFFAACVPPKTTSQQKRAVRTGAGIRFFKGKNQVAAENTLESVLLPFQPEAPVQGLVALSVDFTWPWRQSDLATKAKRDRAEHLGRVRSGSKPDADNAVKSLQDALVSLRFIERDELVCELRVRKFFGAKPGIRVQITPMDEGETVSKESE